MFLTDHEFGGKFEGDWHDDFVKSVDIISIRHAILWPWNIYRAGKHR